MMGKSKKVPMHTENNWKEFSQIHFMTKKIMLTEAKLTKQHSNLRKHKM